MNLYEAAWVKYRFWQATDRGSAMNDELVSATDSLLTTCQRTRLAMREAKHYERSQSGVLRFRILPITLNALITAAECHTALLVALDALVVRWDEGRKELVAGVKESPSPDLKRMIKERAEAFEICRDELVAALVKHR